MFGGTREAIGLAWRAGPRLLLIYVALAIVGGAVPVVVSWLTKVLLDQLASGGVTPDVLTWLAIGLGLVGLAIGTLPHATRYVSGELERAVALLADDRLYAAVNRFAGLGRFEDPVFLDRLRVAQLSGGVTPGRLVGGGLALLRGLITTAGFLASLIVISPLMAVAVVSSAAPMMVAELLLSRQRARLQMWLSPVSRREISYGELLTSVEAAKEVRLLGIGAFLRGRMRANRLAANREERRIAGRELVTQGALSLLATSIAGAGLLWAVRAAGSGTLSVGDVTMFVAAVAGVQTALGSLVGELADAHHQLLLFQHYRAVVGAAPDLPLPARLQPVPVLRRGIEFHDVWFRYSPEHPWVLRGVSMVIPHGQAVGLVGLNGAGKSTLVKLLCRFYDPDRGTIWWDGVDLRDLSPESLRARIGAVFQDYMCYDLTAAENIGVGDLDVIDERSRIEQAGERAGAHSTVAALPRGYDTMLSRMFFGELGETEEEDPATGVYLSGGQWQRIALARAMLRSGRDLMILDEPSSGLDAEAEYEVHRRLAEHRRGATSLLISHRLGALRDVDLIVVLGEGRVTEHGTHDELVASGGAYARLFATQARGYRATDERIAG